MNLPKKLNKAYQIYLYVCSKSRDGWNVVATFLIEATSWFVRLLRRTSPLLHLSQHWRKSTCKQQWRGRSTVARLAADLAPPSKCPERSVKWLAAWALKSYLNLFVLLFCSFCFVFPSVSFFLCFMGFSRSLRLGPKVCSEHKNDWQYLSPGDLQQNEFFPESKCWGFLEVFFFLTFNYGHMTCHVTKIENEGDWRIGGEFTLLG